MSDPIKVTIVEDQHEIREGLKFLINNTPGYRCAGCFASMEEALPGMTGQQAHIVLMDLGLPGMSGLEGIRRLKQTYPELISSRSPSMRTMTASSTRCAPAPRATC